MSAPTRMASPRKLHDQADSMVQFARCLVPGDGAGRTSEGLRRLATVLPALGPHRTAGGCWRGACEALAGGGAALIVRCRPSQSTGGTRQAKAQPANENYVHSGNESPGQTFGN